MDPTVKKILNNGGFMAALAPLLASAVEQKSVRSKAKDLGRHATAYVKMLAAVGYSWKAENGWGGCDQARLILHWIDLGVTDDEADDVIEQIHKWIVVLEDAIADLAHGKLPS